MVNAIVYLEIVWRRLGTASYLIRQCQTLAYSHASSIVVQVLGLGGLSTLGRSIAHPLVFCNQSVVLRYQSNPCATP